MGFHFLDIFRTHEYCLFLESSGCNVLISIVIFFIELIPIGGGNSRYSLSSQYE